MGKLTAILKEGAAMSCRLQAGSQFDEVRFGDVDVQIPFAERYVHAQPGSFTLLHASTNSVTVTLDCLGGFLGTPGDVEDMKITAIPVDSFTNTPA